ncbi:OmpA family protein [Flavicella sediminum]|uniref:OmpA family protein n=1 Tax=Flavicella sediminum TaxID=2585141 RepID=UPI0011200AB0|nr:OmpA family protein [Flavicella sediminum]
MLYINRYLVALVFTFLFSIVSFGQLVEKDTLVSKSVFKEQPFNTWSVGAGFSNLIMHGDLRSFGAADGRAYYNFGLYAYVDKMFNPIFGLEFKMHYSSLGGGKQSFSNPEGDYYDILYTIDFPDENFYMDGITFGGELNAIISVDNLWKHNSEKWNFNVYAGVGYQKYNSRLLIRNYDPLRYLDDVSPEGVVIEADYGYNPYRKNSTNFAKSVYLNTGLGVKYRLNKKIDLEVRSSIYVNHEDHFDAAISNQQNYENYFVTNIGVVYKFGKKERSAIWYHEPEEEDPFELPDTDGDGVADLFDMEEDTPKEAKVHGNGVAIDTDMDGLQDYKDNCPFVPGPIENIGCPYPVEEVVAEVIPEVIPEPVPVIAPIEEDQKQRIREQIALLSKSIYFKTSSAELKTESYKPLNEIAGIMIEYPQSMFKIEGHTDSRGKAEYNLSLSERRAKSVKDYLVVENSIGLERLSSKGYGEVRPIKTNDTEEGRQFNRRVEINFIDPDTPEGRAVYGTDVTFHRETSREVNVSVGTPGVTGAVLGVGTGKTTVALVDTDGDGVTDAYDKEPNTPADVRVYGNGVSVDSDNDGIPDYKDDCPFEKGGIGLNGCSDDIAKEDIKLNYSVDNVDTDGDGVADVYDKEPNTPEGVKVYGNGVSVDSDNDGIADYKDDCPFEKGSIAKNGCSDELEKEDIKLNYSIDNVDTDGDGVADVYDKEPNTPEGVKVYGNGVSVDSDNDGIPDYKDDCPFEKGAIGSNGCSEREVVKSSVSAEDVEAVVSVKFVDTDKDGVADIYDQEPNTPAGAKVYGNGVSVDSDDDGIADYQDNCPFEKGNSTNKGCPETSQVAASKVTTQDVEAVVSGKFVDTDGDGVIDLYDKEPNTPKESRVYGDGVSIDSDLDGIPDYKDACPFEKGLASKLGCPLVSQSVAATVPVRTNIAVPKKSDQDGDGVADAFDKEPNTPANVRVSSNGVAIDSDNDGVPDYKDRCPSVRGVASKDGCPEKVDSDGDGIEDQFDLCPNVKGNVANNGCPNADSISDVGDQLNALASRIRFSRSEGHILKSNNLAILSQIADKLNNYRATRFKIEVHTAARPNLKYNLELSKRRAYAINKYLTKTKGIAQNRIEVVGLGGTNLKYPSEDDPKYKENDRVEMYIK